MKVALVNASQMGMQHAAWKLQKDLAEAERILDVRRKAVREQERKVERLRAMVNCHRSTQRD